MNKAMRACLGGLPAVLLSAMTVRAEKPETDYVVLTLPADWELAEPMRFTYLEGGALLVRHKGDDLLAGIALLSFWYEGMEDLRKAYESEIWERGCTVERSVVSGNVLRVDGSGDGGFRGRHYGVVGEEASSQVVSTAPPPSKRGMALLHDNLKPCDPTLFPTSWQQGAGRDGPKRALRRRHFRRVVPGPARVGNQRRSEMKSIFVLCGGCLLSILLLAGAVRADEVKTPHYTLDLPSEWLVPRPVNTLSNGNAYVILANKRDKTTVSIATMIVALPLEELVEKTVQNMRRAGFDTIEKKRSDHARVVECVMEDGTRAVHYFCVDGKLSSVVSILGTRLDSGRALLQEHFKPVNARLFPTSYEEEPPAASPASPASEGQGASS